MRLLYLSFLFIIIGNCVNAAYHPDEEQRLKFLYIKNFIKNIEWPNNSKKEFKIGVLGERSIYEKISMTNIRPEHANGTSIAYYYFEDSDKLLNCQLIYIPVKKSSELEKVVKYFENQSVLIISETENACQKGSMINFYKASSGKISFEFNPDALHNANLLYSSNFMEQGILIKSIQ